MNSLLKVMRKHFYIVIFILLEWLSLEIFFSNNSYQNSVVSRLGLQLSGVANTASQGVNRLFYLKENNVALQKENILLRQQLNMCSSKPKDTSRHNVADPTGNNMYSYINANILYNSINLKNNYIVIDVGSKGGVEPGMAVLSPRGIVGVVKEVSSNFSSIISFLHSQSIVSVRIKGSAYSGSLSWTGRGSDMAELDEIPSHVDIRIGQSVVTSGYSLIYPNELEVGYVVGTNKTKGAEYQKLKIRLNQDFKTISNVYVVKNLYRTELQSVLDGVSKTEY